MLLGTKHFFFPLASLMSYTFANEIGRINNIEVNFGFENSNYI